MVFNQNQLQTSTAMNGWWRPCKLGHRKVQGGYGRCTGDLRGLLRSSLFLHVNAFLLSSAYDERAAVRSSPLAGGRSSGGRMHERWANTMLARHDDRQRGVVQRRRWQRDPSVVGRCPHWPARDGCATSTTT